MFDAGPDLEDNSNVVVEYLDEHGEMSKADLVKVLVQSGACSQSHSYRLIDQAISSKILIESDDGYLKIMINKRIKGV